MLIESGLVSEGSINGVLSGKHYNRSVMSHKIIYEALQRLRFEAFMETLDNESREYIQSLVKATEVAFNEDKLNDFIETDQFADLIYSYNSWVSLCKYAVNLSGGQPQLY